MEVIITANGEHENAHCLNLGHCTDRLSEKGMIESFRLAKTIQQEKIDFIFCSDIWFRRTTTDLVLETLKNQAPQIVVDPRLREKWAEICTHLTKENFEITSDSTPEQREILNRLFIKTDIMPHPTPKNESSEQVYERCKNFLNELTKQYPSSSKILIVWNPIVNWHLISLMKKKENNENSFLTTPCSISRYLYRGNHREEKEFNSTSHLHQR